MLRLKLISVSKRGPSNARLTTRLYQFISFKFYKDVLYMCFHKDIMYICVLENILYMCFHEALLYEIICFHINSSRPMLHICISKLAIIDWDNGLSPSGHQAIFWTSAGILSIGPLGTNFSEILNAYIFINKNAFENGVCKMASISSQPQWVNTPNMCVLLFICYSLSTSNQSH